MNPKSVMLSKTMSFLRATKRAYGEEKCAEVWTEVSKLIGDDELTMSVMQSLLTGAYSGHEIMLKQWRDFPVSSATSNYDSSKIPAIKTLRAWTMLGLKEAKNAVEGVAATNTMIEPKQFKIAHKYWMTADGEELEIDYDKLLNDFKSVGLDVEII